MPEFTARLSDGSMFKVNAPSREVAEGLIRTEDQYRREQANTNPITGGQMGPEEFQALSTLPPPPNGPIQVPTAQRLAAMGSAGRTGAELRAGGGGPPTVGSGLFEPPPEHSALRPVLETLGAAGTLAATGGLGAPLATAGAVGRAALATGGGAALGSLGFDALRSALGGDVAPGDAYRKAGEAAAFEVAALGTGEAGAGAVRLGQRAIARLDAQLTTLAEQYGIRMGIEDLSTAGYLRRARQVIGRFPFMASPFGEASQRVGGDIAEAVQTRISNVAPVYADPFKVSTRTIREAKAAWQSYRDETNRLYETWRSSAKANGATFSPNITRQRATELLQESAEKAAEFAGAGKAKLQPDPLARMAKRITELADGQTVAVYDGLRKDLQGVQVKLKNPHDRARVGALLEGLELDLRSTISNAESAQQLQKADLYYREGKRIFETSTAKRMGRFQRGIFEVGEMPEPTTADVQKAVQSVFSTGNVRAVREYRALVGEQTFRQATRLHLQDNFNKALQIIDTGKDAGKVRLNMDQLSRDLGLFNPKSERRAALASMLRGTGVEVKDLENLVRLAQRAAESGPVDVSTFVSRRAVLGGFKSAIGSVAPGAETLTGPRIGVEILKSLTVLAGGRRLGRWLTDPRAVKNLTQALNPGLQQSARTAAFIRFGRLIENDQQESPYAVPQAALAGGLMGPLTTAPSPVMSPLRAATGAGQAGLGAFLSRRAGGR